MTFGKKNKIRFNFGKNWKNFLRKIDDNKINLAMASLNNLLGYNLKNKSFLDIGSGSGIFSLAARKLNMKVYSIDIDPESIKCTKALKNKYFRHDKDWTIKKISLLSKNFKQKINKNYKYIYCWGVAHHTGNMYQSFKKIISISQTKTKLVLAIYNKQFLKSYLWLKIKYLFNLNVFFKLLFILFFFPYFFLIRTILHKIKNKKDARGMNNWNDMIDWLGGYPYQFEKPSIIINFFKKNNFKLIKKNLCGDNLGCNEFVFEKQ